MSSTVLRFECVIPNTDSGTPQNAAVLAFINNLAGLTTTVRYQAIVTDTLGNDTFLQIVYGYLTAAQQATALGFLTTLNTALGKNSVCAVWNGTLEP